MPTPNAFDYAVIRVVPHIAREEFFNAGVILFCPQQKYLAARVHLDVSKLAALAPHLDPTEIQERLHTIPRIAAADPSAGPIAHLSQRARFHWLVAPRSTLIQISPVHSGLCGDPDALLNRLFAEQVLTVSA